MLICQCGYENFPGNEACRRCDVRLDPENASIDKMTISEKPKQRAYVKPDPGNCLVCLAQKATHILIHGDGAHQGFCGLCAETLHFNNSRCPLCRENIDDIVRLY